MTTRRADRAAASIRRLARVALTDKAPDEYGDFLAESARAFEAATERVSEAANRVVGLASVAATSAEDARAGRAYSINPLGVLQSTGPTLDRAAALLQEAADQMTAVLHYGRALGYVVDVPAEATD